MSSVYPQSTFTFAVTRSVRLGSSDSLWCVSGFVCILVIMGDLKTPKYPEYVYTICFYMCLVLAMQ